LRDGKGIKKGEEQEESREGKRGQRIERGKEKLEVKWK